VLKPPGDGWSRGRDDGRKAGAAFKRFYSKCLLSGMPCRSPPHLEIMLSLTCSCHCLHTHNTHVYIRAVYRRGVESARRDAAHVWHGMATLELQLGHIDTARDLFREVAKSSRSSSGGMKKRVFLALLCHVSHMLFCLCTISLSLHQLCASSFIFILFFLFHSLLYKGIDRFTNGAFSSAAAATSGSASFDAAMVAAESAAATSALQAAARKKAYDNAGQHQPPPSALVDEDDDARGASRILR